MPPIFFICAICVLEVLEVEVLALLELVGELLRFLRVDLGVRLLDEREDVAHAEDARGHAVGVERLRGRPASRETPTNLIGLPVTWRTESAAPPRESPSSLVRMTPVSGSASLKARATFTASWPCIESTTKSVSIGLHRGVQRRISCIIASSIARRPAVSTMSTS